MEIAILRHGKPNQITEKTILSSHFRNWINIYNSSGLSRDSLPPKKVLDYANSCEVIVSSTLQRSIDSAHALNNGKNIISDNQFIEAGLPSANYPLIKMSPKYWAVLFRTLWLLGYSNNSESIQEAKQRAKKAVEKLINLAHEHQKLLFVGHGIFNRLLANYT